MSTPEKTWEPSCSNKVRVKDSSFEVKLGLCVVRYREVLQLRLEVGSSADIPVLRSLTLRRMESFLGIDGTSPITLSEGGFIGRFLDWFEWDEKHYPRKHILASLHVIFGFVPSRSTYPSNFRGKGSFLSCVATDLHDYIMKRSVESFEADSEQPREWKRAVSTSLEMFMETPDRNEAPVLGSRREPDGHSPPAFIEIQSSDEDI